MADTTTAPNNKAVAYGGRKRKPLREPSGVARAKRAMKRGLISAKAAKRHLQDL
jgi:hypothetical protein